MCLTLTVRVPEAARDALAAAVATLPASAVSVAPPPTGAHARRWPWSRPVAPEARAGCACDLLADDADWNAPTWAMHATGRAALAATLGALAGVAPGAVVEVLWAGDAVEREMAVTPAELVELAQASALGRGTWSPPRLRANVA
jgi:hypothetical protein